MSDGDGPHSVIRPVVVALVALAAAVTVLTGTVFYTEADTRGTLLVAEQILDNRTITLDAYDPAYLARHYNFYEQGGRTFDFFPLGTSVVTLPAVAVAKAAGVDVFTSNAPLQITIAALAAALTVLLLYLLARQFLPFGVSITLAGATWFGTTLASTGGTALWSHVFAVVFALLALLVMVRIGEFGQHRLWPWLAVSLFAAYLCRPTMILLMVFVVAYVAVRTRPVALATTAALAVLFIAFIGVSEALYGTWLPRYYQPQRLGASRFAEAVLGHLVSPSRGLLVFSPVVLAIPVLALIDRAQVRRRAALLFVALGWPTAHWLMASLHPQWYGGFSYGPRLMTDVIPGLFLAVVLLWPADPHTWPSRLAIGFGAVLAVFGIWIHTVQGLHNQETLMWNVVPRVEEHPEKVWDWRFPQWLATPEREAQRHAEYSRATSP